MYLGGVDDALCDHVNVLALVGVVAEVLILAFQDLSDHDGALFAGVLDDGLARDLDGSSDDVDSHVLVEVVALKVLERSGRV